MANFEAFCGSFSLNTNLLFLKSVEIISSIKRVHFFLFRCIYIPIELAGANSPAPLIMALLEVKDELFLMEDPEADPPDPGAKLKLVLDMDCGDDEGVIISLYSNL